MDEESRWRTISLGNLRAAKLLYDSGEYRASVTRAYYAAYQVATGVCVGHGDAGNFPQDWNNPTHDQLPDLIRNNGDIAIVARRRVSQQLRVLRRVREDADYRSGQTVDSIAALNALHGATMILEILGVS